MTSFEIFAMIFATALATMLTRFLPFLVFKSSKPTPKFLEYLGKALPPAVFGMLVVYCLKEISFTAASGFLPEIIGIAATLGLHIAFRKMLFSIVGGTAVYMLLVNIVFV